MNVDQVIIEKVKQQMGLDTFEIIRLSAYCTVLDLENAGLKARVKELEEQLAAPE